MFVRIEYVGERKKKMFYLTTHSTHFIYGYMMSDIWQRTTQIAKEETRCRHMGYSFRLFCMHHPTDRITHTTVFVKPVMEHWLERQIAQWVHHEGSIRRLIAPSLILVHRIKPITYNFTLQNYRRHCPRILV